MRAIPSAFEGLKFQQMLAFSKLIVDSYGPSEFTSETEKVVLMAEALLKAGNGLLKSYEAPETPSEKSA